MTTTGSITILRGLPGSGKTTVARQWMALEPTNRVRSNRDDLRSSIFDATGVLDYSEEQIVTSVQKDQVRSLVRAGKQVIVDDTNLRLKFARAWADLAHDLGVPFHVTDVTTNVDLCVLRDKARGDAGGREVGEDVIRGIAARFPVARWPKVERTPDAQRHAWDVYTAPDPSAITAFLVDLDGTVAKKRMGEGERGWYEYERVGEDLPNGPVIDLVNVLADHHRIVFMSGRKDYCRAATQGWLEEHIGGWAGNAELFMRADDDNRSDDLVKHDLFNEHVRHNGSPIVGVLDDRDRVVAMWREIGLQVYQVAPGAF